MKVLHNFHCSINPKNEKVAPYGAAFLCKLHTLKRIFYKGCD